jgi:hypothetical protein
MGVMRKNLLLAIALLAFLTVPAKAAVTVEQSTDPEYLINQGYSQLTAEDVLIQKNRANGKPVEPLYEKSQNKFVKACRKFYAYIDPAQDLPDRLHHDVSPSPSWSDL